VRHHWRVDGGERKKMKITRVRIHKLHAPLRERFGWSLNWTNERTATLVEVATDDGITGWGDGEAAEETLLRRPDVVIGRSPFEVEAIFDELRVSGGPQERSVAARCGGLDMAIWDVIGQALGKPVARLLGRQYRNRIRPYCTALYRKDWADLAQGLAEEARMWKGRGFHAIKMKIGYGAELDVHLVKTVKNAVGDGVGLAVDSNCAYDAGAALALGAQLEPFHLLWWEEPVLASDHEGYRRLRGQLRIPLAGGETLNLDQLICDYIQTRLVDILQPEVEIIGLTGARRITPLCWLNYIRLAPHNWSTAIRTASILHWTATIPPVTQGLYGWPVTLEFDQTEHPFRDAVVANPPRLEEDGCLAVPALPGLGVQVRPHVVAEFRKELIEVV